MLSYDAFQRATRFLREHARPLEHAQFEHDFGEGPAAAVVDALACFQNDDGGYGHGLEPDRQGASSGALATARALPVLSEAGVGDDHPHLAAAVAYLRATLDPKTLTWRIVPPDTGSSPHAPWWGREGLEDRFGHFRINPRGDVLAGLYRFPEVAEETWIEPVAEDCVRAIETRELEMHDLLNAVALLEAPGLPVGLRARVRAVVEDSAARMVSTRWEEWHQYGLQPLKVAPRPDAALHHMFAEPLQWNLDFLIETQGEDGAWAPSWSWGQYPEAWEEARRAWQGILTLEALRALRAFGRVDGGAVPAPG